MKQYYGKFKDHKTYHVILANTVADARAKMQKGTRYTLSEIIIKTKKPKTKYPICGRV